MNRKNMQIRGTPNGVEEMVHEMVKEIVREKEETNDRREGEGAPAEDGD